MVFNTNEGTNDTDQPANKSKYRKTVPTGRKGKTVASNLSPTKEVLPANPAGKAANPEGFDKTIMGNISAQRSGNDNEESKQEVSEVEANHSGGKRGGSASNNGSACLLPQENIEEEIEKLHHEGGNCENPAAEIARLKRLLLLQVSLISRQQDLLRLRDREIMQLKSSNSNYKCQLSRVRRRISKRKNDGQDDSPKAAKKKTSEGSSDQTPRKTKSVTLVNTETQTPVALSVFNEEKTSKSKKRRLEYQESPEASNSNVKRTDAIKIEDTPGPSHTSTDDSVTAESIPVPISFADQVQNRLVQALLISPPDKTVTSGTPNLPIKVCDRCPHCVAYTQKITRLLKIAEKAENSKFIDSVDLQEEFFKLAGITSRGCDYQPNGGSIPTNIPIMQTSTSFHRLAPSFDHNHWWWDLKCDNIVQDKNLKIPTWKVHEIAPIQDIGEEVEEATDDQTYIKRHAKLELDEKRRKKWDIQRIREFRYTEKLRMRQKLNKQGLVYDSASIESFSGPLHDAESVEVGDSLPVNVFGYPVPHLNLEEFSLSRIRSSSTTGGKKRTKKT